MDTIPSNHADIKLSVADLLPLAGLTDRYDDAIFALCEIDAHGAAVTPGDPLHACCAQTRRALDADTVYLCKRDDLQVLSSSAADAPGRVHPDTLDIHLTLMSIVSDLEHCSEPLRLPDLRVFSDATKMSFVALPVGAQNELLMVIVDPEQIDSLFTGYLIDAIKALFVHVTQVPTDRLSTSYLQEQIFDALNHRYPGTSPAIAARRQALFHDALRQLTVKFEPLTENNGSGDSTPWGWQVVPACDGEWRIQDDLAATAQAWGAAFRYSLDRHLLNEAAHQYKALCDMNAQTHFSQVKPLCVAISAQSLCQPAYVETIRTLIEKCVINGESLVFELLHQDGSHRDSQADDQRLAAKIEQMRSEFGIQIALDEFGKRNLSVARYLTSKAQLLKLNRSILTGQSRHMALQLLEQFAALTHDGSDRSLELILHRADQHNTVRPAPPTARQESVQARQLAGTEPDSVTRGDASDQLSRAV